MLLPEAVLSAKTQVYHAEVDYGSVDSEFVVFVFLERVCGWVGRSRAGGKGRATPASSTLGAEPDSWLSRGTPRS